MPSNSQPAPVSNSTMDALVSELYARSNGEKFGLSRQDFSAILAEVAGKYLTPQATPAETRDLYISLRIEELALARSCAAGNDSAWESFLIRYRAKLYDIAGYIAKEPSAARDLADSLYADLYGVNAREGRRTSKLSSYTGRGSLEGWLRTVLAQEFVNRYRRQRRLVSLEEESEEGIQFSAPSSEPAARVDERLEAATDEALAALPPEDRLVLAAYYLDGSTLAEIARLLKVHESTISRKLDKLAKLLRKNILQAMCRRGMSRRQAEEALETDVRDLRLDIRKHLAQDSPAKTFSKEEMEARATDGSG
jgi:RNA polymerase sigma-70 factor, ECF subfamily